MFSACCHNKLIIHGAFFVSRWWAWSSRVGYRGKAVHASHSFFRLCFGLHFRRLNYLPTQVTPSYHHRTQIVTYAFIWSVWILSLEIVSKENCSFIFWMSFLFYVHYIANANLTSKYCYYIWCRLQKVWFKIKKWILHRITACSLVSGFLSIWIYSFWNNSPFLCF